MSANAIDTRPVKIPNNITIGAMALVTKSCDIEGAVLIGVPANVK